MKSVQRTYHLGLLALFIVALNLHLPTALGQGTAFTYQGQLDTGGVPANGLYDLRFTLHNAITGGPQLGAALTNSATAVADGLFTVVLDFGSRFPGVSRWLEISVRTNGAQTFNTLSPRQALTPVPYAIYAGGADGSGVTGPLPPSALVGLALNATNLTGSVNDARLSPNVALRAGGNTFSGTQTIRNGAVGIGTATPATALHVAGSGSTEISLESTSNKRRWTLQATDNNSLAPNTFQIIDRTAAASRIAINTNGNVGIGTIAPTAKLHVDGEVTCVAVNITSDRNAKEQFKPVSGREVLAKVAALPITEWQYKTQSDARHIGPMAQDFHSAFGTGRDDKHITSVDADGVALAAIQGLNQIVQDKDAELGRLKAENQSLAERLVIIERLLGIKMATTTGLGLPLQ